MLDPRFSYLDMGCRIGDMSYKKRVSRIERRVTSNETFLHTAKLLIKFKFDSFSFVGIKLTNADIKTYIDQKLLPFVEKPARYLGIEQNVI